MIKRDYIQRRVPNDLSKIDIREHWQITFWTLELRTTQERLTKAVREVGPDAADVREWLNKKSTG